MIDNIQVGDCVKLLGLPDWLTHDLPLSEQEEMLEFIGKSGVVSEIDCSGNIWLGFGSTTVADDDAYYCGHSFCVPIEFVTRVDCVQPA